MSEAGISNAGVIIAAIIACAGEIPLTAQRGVTCCFARRDRGRWSEPRSLGVPLAKVDGSDSLLPVDWPISACSTGDGRVQLLARGPDGQLLHAQLREGGWSGSENASDCQRCQTAMSPSQWGSRDLPPLAAARAETWTSLRWALPENCCRRVGTCRASPSSSRSACPRCLFPGSLPPATAATAPWR